MLYRLDITLQGHLLVAGGQASASGANLTTALRLQAFEDESGNVRLERLPYIPATALRGAVRMQLEALLKGDDKDHEVVDPYFLDAPAAKERPERLNGTVARLFGYSGESGARSGAGEGALRFSDALPAVPALALKALKVRPGLELEDFSSTAADKKLFFREVAEITAEPLVFQADLMIAEARLKGNDLICLQATIEATDAIGAGKAKGGGEVSIRWTEGPAPAAVRVHGDPSTATRARLLFTLAEPAHFGDGGPYANHHATRTFIPGATVRGAVAWTLLRNGPVKAEDAEFKALFLEDAPASFGDALLVHEAEAEPTVFSATAQKRRGGENEIRNVLVTELARRRVNGALAESGLHLRADDGEDRFDPIDNARPAEDLVRHTRTRVSIDRWTGTAAEGRLFSIEQIDPALSRKEEDPKNEKEKKPVPARFVSWVERLNPASAGLLARLAGLTVLIGAGRNHGLGLVEVDIRFESEPETKTATERVRAFASAVETQAAELCRRAGIADPPAAGDGLPLALVALSDYVSSEDIDHPLAEPALAGLRVSGPERRFLHPSVTGGYDQRPENGAPLKDLLSAVGAGSVFVYSLAETDLQSALDRLLPALRKGVGQRVESGCGRFGLFAPEAAKENKMSPEPENGLKSWMVKQAETILDEAKEKEGFGDAASQLRNLVQITQHESEIAVLRNFLNYQRGRRATHGFWSLVHKPVLDVLDEIGTRTAKDGPEARRLAIQQFFGYLVRHYIYLDRLKRERREKEKREREKRPPGQQQRDAAYGRR